MPWLAHHNPEIDWKTGEVQITRCPEFLNNDINLYVNSM